MSSLAQTITRLCDISRKRFINPYVNFDWPEALDMEQWFVSPELISIYGTDIYNDLSLQQKQRLSFYEAVNFFSLNIHGERSLIEGLAQRLYRTEHNQIAPYLHHFLDEENKHMLYFGGFCLRYAGKIYPNKKMVFPREYAPKEEDFLFFAKVLIFEEIVDVYNRTMAKDERLAPVARQINLFHHLDEVRHLAFGRKLVKDLFDRYSRVWSKETIQRVSAYLTDYLTMTWKEYYNAHAYHDAGLQNPFSVADTVFHNPAVRSRRQAVTQVCLRYLLDNNILDKEPVL
jgi:P-aminobenzoate N-oxygenase AurF